MVSKLTKNYHDSLDEKTLQRLDSKENSTLKIFIFTKNAFQPDTAILQGQTHCVKLKMLKIEILKNELGIGFKVVR